MSLKVQFVFAELELDVTECGLEISQRTVCYHPRSAIDDGWQPWPLGSRVRTPAAARMFKMQPHDLKQLR
jgi:hypothetical protein